MICFPQEAVQRRKRARGQQFEIADCALGQAQRGEARGILPQFDGRLFGHFEIDKPVAVWRDQINAGALFTRSQSMSLQSRKTLVGHMKIMPVVHSRNRAVKLFAQAAGPRATFGNVTEPPIEHSAERVSEIHSDRNEPPCM